MAQKIRVMHRALHLSSFEAVGSNTSFLLQRLFTTSVGALQAADSTNPGQEQKSDSRASQDRQASGSQASTSQSTAKAKQNSAWWRDKKAKTSPPQRGKNSWFGAPQTTLEASKASREKTSFGAPQTTLEAKKAYREVLSKKKQQTQQTQAAAQAFNGTNIGQSLEDRQADAPSSLPSADDEEQSNSSSEELESEESWDGFLSEATLDQNLEESDIGMYVSINRELLPEIFARKGVSEEGMHPKGGYHGIELEIQDSNADRIMLRPVIQNLLDVVQAKDRKQLYLTGPPASGKSVALAAIVNRMRAQNWLVWYIPQPLQLTHGGFFSRNPDGSYDTPEIAKLLMRYLLAGNPGRMAELRLPNGESAKETIENALTQTEPDGLVDLFMQVKEAVCNADNVLIAIDDYQELYSLSEYGQWMSQHHRRVIDSSELRVAKAMRLLEQSPLRDGVALCASHRSGRYSKKARLPIAKDALFNVPSMDFFEWVTMADYYMLQETTTEVDLETVLKCFILTGANPKEYRLHYAAFDFEDADC